MNLVSTLKKSIEENLTVLMEQQTTVNAFKLDQRALDELPQTEKDELNKTFFSEYANSKAKEFIDREVDLNLTPEESLSTLVKMGITPYVFRVPTDLLGNGFVTTGINFKIKNTPLNFSLNLGTDPEKIFDSMKWSQVGLNLKF